MEEELPIFLLLLQGLSAEMAMVMPRSSSVKGGGDLLRTQPLVLHAISMGDNMYPLTRTSIKESRGPLSLIALLAF